MNQTARLTNYRIIKSSCSVEGACPSSPSCCVYWQHLSALCIGDDFVQAPGNSVFITFNAFMGEVAGKLGFDLS
jgi:hypothetical protein